MDLFNMKNNCKRAFQRIKRKVCEDGESCMLVRLIDCQLGIKMNDCFYTFFLILSKIVINKKQWNFL